MSLLRKPYQHRKLKLRMIQQNLSQEEVSRAMGITRATLRAKLHGRSQWSIGEMLDLAELLEIPEDELAAHFFEEAVRRNKRAQQASG